MNDVLKIGLDINLKGLYNYDTDIGLYNGRLRFSETGGNIGSLGTKAGVLAENWVSNISKSVDIRRNGNYASLNGSTIKLSNNFGLLEYLKLNNISLYNQKVSVIYDYTPAGGVKESGVLYTGIITKVDTNFDYITIKTESVSKNYVAPTTTKIFGSDIYAPMFIGKTSEGLSCYNKFVYPNTGGVEYTKGVEYNGGESDVLTNDILTPVLWKVEYSNYERVYLYPLNKTLSLEQFNQIKDELKTIDNSINRGLPFLLCIDGEGKDEKFPINTFNVDIEQDDNEKYYLEIRLGSTDVEGTKNKFPNGLVGNFYDPYNRSTAQTPYSEPLPDTIESSIVKFIEVNNFVQMDTFTNSKCGYGEKSYLYDEDNKVFVEAPYYIGGFYNDKDKMIQLNSTGDAQLGFKSFQTIGGNLTKIGNSRYDDLTDLTINVFPEELKKFYCFESGTDKTLNGWWVKTNSLIYSSGDIPSFENVRKIIDGDKSTSYRTSVFTNYTEINQCAYVLKLGMPEFSKKPNNIYFTCEIEIDNNSFGVVDQCVALIVNDFREGQQGWKVIDYKICDDINDKKDVFPKPYTGDKTFVKNLFPYSVDVNGNYENPSYEYINSNLDGNQMNSSILVNRASLEFNPEDYVLDEQSEMFVMFGINYNPLGQRVDIEFKECAWVGVYDSDPSKTAFKYNARSFSNDNSRSQEMVHPSKVYEHVLRLQNFSSESGITKPIDGWGSKYPNVSTWDNLIDSSSNNGGTSNPILAPNITIEGQKMTYSESNTDSMKKELNKLMWSMGTISNNGVEKIYPIIPSITEDIGTLITYNDIDGDYKFNTQLYTDIFTEGKIKYKYNNVAGDFLGEISINNVDADSFKESYVTGISDINVAGELWSLANKLYQTYKVIKPFPSDVGEVKLIDSEAGAIEYLRNLYTWQGVRYDEYNSLIIDERYTASFKIPLDFYIENNLDHGSPIKLDIPTITTVGNEHKGIITDVSIAIKKESPIVTITASMRGDITVGGDTILIIESGNETLEYIESGSEEINIVESGN